jgi:hypothetical protein
LDCYVPIKDEWMDEWMVLLGEPEGSSQMGGEKEGRNIRIPNGT